MKAGASKATHARQQALSHISILDGFRGIAILVVMLFHFSWAFGEGTKATYFIKHVFWAGWFGVDLFFVLSGYLISRGLLVESKHTVGQRMRNFWFRRVLRIFPLYYAAIIVGTILCLATSARIPEWPYWVYAQNYSLAFDPDPERWTSHLWSLAIEEQFYLVWPALLLVIPKRAHVGTILSLVVIGVVLRVGIVITPQIWGGDPLTAAKLAYRALPTRMDGLLLGALVAVVMTTPDSVLLRTWRKYRRFVLAVSALALLTLIAWTGGLQFYDRRVIVFGYGLLAVFFATVVLTTVDGALPTYVARVFDGRWLGAIGRVSYGMYVIHWPLVAFGIPYFKRIQDWTSTPQALSFGIVVTIVGITLTYVLAWLSFHYFETPFLRLKHRFKD
ncbi:MAG: acyltransferase [Polyangiaceae bacterium]|nr:acyltransferase [Polyangiaceae bacterium]